MKTGSRLFVGLALVALLFGSFSMQAQASNYSDAVLADGPAGYWSFDDAVVEDGATAANSVDGAPDGIYVGGTSKIKGAAGDAVLINPERPDTANDYVKVLAPEGGWDALSSTSATYEMLVKPSYGGHPEGCCGNIVVRGGYFTGGATFVQQRPGETGNTNAGPNATNPAQGGYLVPNSWNHLAVTFDGSVDGLTTTAIYINGKRESFDEIGGSACCGGNGKNPFAAPVVMNDDSADGLSIGALPFGPEDDIWESMLQAFKGGVDEVAYYDRALGGAEVLSHFEASGVVPEPGTAVLLVLGLLGVLGVARQRS